MAGERATGGGGKPFLDAGIDAELQRAVGSGKPLAYIIVFSGDSPGRIYAMTRSTIIVGRDDDVDMQVLDASVSAHHARIVNRSNGFEIEDLNSTNGMFLGGNRIDRAALRNGDRLTVGGVELMFLLDRPTSATIRLPDPSRLARPGLVAPGRVGLLAPHDARAYAAAPPRPRKSEDEMSLADMVRKLARIYNFVRERAVLILVAMMLGTAVGLASVPLLPPVISASSEVKLLHRFIQLANQSDDHSQTADDSSPGFVRSAERSLTQVDMVRATLEKLEAEPPRDARVISVLAGLRVEEIGDHLFRVTFKDRSRIGPPPVEFLTLHLQAYVQGEVTKSVREVKAKVDFLSDQLKTVEADLNAVSAQRAGFREAHAYKLPEDAALTQTSRHNLETRRADLLSEIHHLQAGLKAEEGQLSDDQPAARTRFQWSETYRQSQAEVNRKLSEAYARGLSDAHPEIRQLKEERERLQSLAKEELQASTSSVVRQSDPNYQEARRRVDKLRGDLTAARANLAETERSLGQVRSVEKDMPRIEQQISALDHKQLATKTLHGELFSKLKQAEIQLNLEKVSAESRYDITPAVLERPARSALLGTRGLIGLFAGLALSALLILLREGRTLLSQALASEQAAAVPTRPGADTSARLLGPGARRRDTPT